VRARYPNLLYLDDAGLYEMVQQGACETGQGRTRVNVTRKRFARVGTTRPDSD
jgi:hypothetical protein